MAELYDATDLDYNADSRALLSQVEIYFDEDTPTTITKDDYLIDWDILEEVGSDSNNPIGDSSANELSLSLLNEDGLFSVTNVDGPYYGKIKRGVKVIPYIRTAATNWIQLGTFYVNEWVGSLTGLRTEVTCYDKIHDVFSSPTIKGYILQNISIKNAYLDFFQHVNVPVVVDEFGHNLEWWYTLGSNQATLQELSTASFAGCFCDHVGDIQVKNMAMLANIRAEITDADQLISAETSQTLSREYDGVTLMLNKHQLSSDVLLDIQELDVPPGTSISQPTSFASLPVSHVELAKLAFELNKVELVSYLSNSQDITYVLKNNSNSSAVGSVQFEGKKLTTIEEEYYTEGASPMVINNGYIQTEVIAELQTHILTAFANSDMPYLDIVVRGNPLLQLGDKIKVISNRYGVEFTGYLLRQQFTYTGALTGQLRLLNANILEVV